MHFYHRLNPALMERSMIATTGGASTGAPIQEAIRKDADKRASLRHQGAGARESITSAVQTELTWPAIYARLVRSSCDAEAYVALQRRVRFWAARDVRNLAGGTLLQDDIVSDTCANAILGVCRAYGAETFAGFVYGHYLTVRRGYFRASRRELCSLDQQELIADEGCAPTVDELELLRRCLDSLAPRERRAVMLRYFGCASAREIGAALGVTEVNARRIVYNAIQRLRSMVTTIWPQGRDGLDPIVPIYPAKAEHRCATVSEGRGAAPCNAASRPHPYC